MNTFILLAIVNSFKPTLPYCFEGQVKMTIIASTILVVTLT